MCFSNFEGETQAQSEPLRMSLLIAEHTVEAFKNVVVVVSLDTGSGVENGENCPCPLSFQTASNLTMGLVELGDSP